ncbi:hypothetical protein WJX72_002336 [[Myrmecia] bisecta]|uniref:BAR domain-containing protein n=1 Tax=[Myrmecia] bisecta TaxID=41462 RepID=A0AAW1PJF1_9CHLO
MGRGWRTFSERAKQVWHINPVPDKGFVPTPNTRNELMLTDAGEFANHLKRCEKDIRALKNATEGLLNTTKIVMSAPLPKVFEDAGQGKATPVVSGPGQSGSIGGDFKVDDLTRVAKETAKKLEAEVLAPMQRWTTAYNTVQTRMQRLEAVRLEVDSRRRTVTDLARKIDKQRARVPQKGAKGEFDLDQLIKKQQHKENKLASARQSFKEQEAMVYQQLAQLIRDAVWLKTYIAAVMRLEQEAFQASYLALGPGKAALPMMQQAPVDMPTPLPATPDHIGMIPAGRAVDTPPQNAAGVGTMRSMTNKVTRRQPSGKENGRETAPNPKDYIDAPAAPTHRITRPASATSGYDRYGEQQYGREQPIPAW